MRVITRSEIEAREKLFSKLEAEPTPDEKKDSMLSALSKYIPVTVIVGYTFLDTIFRSITPAPALLWMAIFFVLLVGAGLLTYRITDGPRPDLSALVQENPDISTLLKNWETIVNNQRLKQAAIAMIAFAGYVPAIGGPFTYINAIMPGFVWQAYYGAVALVLATLAIAIIAAKDLLVD
ncbi:MAG: hypothetical protein Q8O19_08310 [Rectinemataceae bacterium]|nr:hypothetical protein [Rectinemataceae bacterium]